MKSFEKVIRSIIRASGGSPNGIALPEYMERFSHSFAFSEPNYWLGVKIMKNPLDLMVLQQILYEKRPDTIIECGTAYGGSAYFLASMMDILNIDGKVITIDIEPNLISEHNSTDIVKVNDAIVKLNIERMVTVQHPKIQVITADCMEAEIPKHGPKTMVILDCHHSASHVFNELQRYSQFVSVGQYLIVEDTDHKVNTGGPAAAVKKFLKKNKDFVADNNREHYGISSNIGGYLIRIS